MTTEQGVRRKPRRRLVAYASTGTNCGPWVRCGESKYGPAGSLAIFETYGAALADSFGPSFVHRVEIFIEREPAKESK